MQDAIASLVHPILAYGLDLKERLDRGESPTIEIEQAALKGLLLSEVESRRHAAFGGDQENSSNEARGRGEQAFLGIRYALTCWLDELFIVDSKWSTAWNERKLEVAFYGSNDRAWKFWAQARLAEGRPGVNALEVFFLCVMMGFRGELRDEPERLRAWVAAAQTQVARGYSQKWPNPPELEPGSNVPPLHGADRFRRLILVAFVFFLVMIPVVTLAVQYLGEIELRLIWRALAVLRMAGGLVLPMLAGARDFAGLGPAALWALRLFALAVSLVVLGVINFALGLPRFLEPPVNFLGHLWLPLLFLLLYTFGWLAWWLWRHLGSEREEAAFPDIDRAWREAVLALERAGIGLNDTPLFLVLGRAPGAEGALFDGAELQLKLRGEPARDDAPIRVYAGREGIYVTCAGASVLGRRSVEVEATDDDDPPGSFDDAPEFKTFGIPGSIGHEAEASILARAQTAGRNPSQLHEEELRALGRIASDRGATRGAYPPAPSSRLDLSDDRASVELQEARLRHLGGMIARDRRPYCPINGILLLVPIASTNSDHAATRVGLTCQRDLAAVRESMRVRCPVFALVCDLENLPGFEELIARLPEEERRRRMGQRFPLMPDVAAEALPAMFEAGVNWIANKQFPARVDSLWRVELAGAGLGMAEAVRGNVQLYKLLLQIRQRLRRLGRVLAHAAITDGKPSAMLGGCYLAGISTDPRSEQAFVPGVFRRLTENQDYVSWTPEQLEREASDNRKVRIGYTALALLTFLFIVLFAYLLFITTTERGS